MKAVKKVAKKAAKKKTTKKKVAKKAVKEKAVKKKVAKKVVKKKATKKKATKKKVAKKATKKTLVKGKANQVDQEARKALLEKVKKNGSALEYADKSLKADREIVLAAVKQNGWALQHADKSLKADRKVVLAAVKQDGSALEYAAKSLKADRKIVFAAVNQSKDQLRDKLYDQWVAMNALDYASEALQKDQELRKIAGKNDDITESDIAELCKSKPEKIQAYFSAWELEKECGVFSVAKGKKIKEVEGYRIWENKSSVILSWKLPKSKKDLFRVLEMSEWKDSDISFDELDGPDSSKGYGSTNYNSKGKELSSVEDFDGFGDTDSDFGSDYYSTEITIFFKGKKSVKFSENSKVWSVGLSGGEQKTLKDYDAVVAVIKKIIK